MGRQSLKTRADRTDTGVTTAATAAKTKPTAKAAANAITKQRTAALEQMNSRLQRKFTQIEKSVNDLRADNLRYYYKIGQICEDIRENPQQYLGHDGTPGLRLVEQALSTQARTLRKAAMFAREYKENELKELIGFFHKETNFQLHWGHVSFLLSLPNAETRRRFAMEAIEHMLDPPALHELIKKKTQRGPSHGRKHEMPKTVAAQIRQINTICKAWLGKNDGVWNGEDESVFGNITNMPPEDMTPEMVEELLEAGAQMTLIAEAAGANVPKISRAAEHMKGCIDKRDKEAAAEQEAGRNTRAIDLDNDGTGKKDRTSSKRRKAS